MKSAPRKTSKTKSATMPAGPKAVQLRHWLLFWTLVLCVMIVINASFAKYQKPSSDLVMETDAMAVIADSLEKQADMLEKQAEAMQEMKPEGRLFITVDNAHGLCGSEAALLDLPADQTFQFRDEKTGVTASLPYNFAWGTDGYGAFPSEVNGFETNSFLFGKVGTYDSGCWFRDSSLTIYPPTSTTSLLRSLSGTQVRQRNVNGLTVLSYSQTEQNTNFTNQVWDAIGRTYWYRIVSKAGQLSDAEAVSIIQSLRVTR
ncbi:hypothetical protein IT407_04705 [Candidatus Uhrbacteria bacterium]|nr:hypothetical protein [Candidatus Uhrbacteria bacterium]